MKPVKQNFDTGKLKAVLQAERGAAIGTALSSDLSEQRMRAYNYYMGDMSDDMPAEDGLSSAVSSDVQDVVEGVLPIILDVLTSSENIVEFSPVGEADAAAAQQETEAINHVFYQENDGFLILYTAIKDCLLSKNCFIKWYMEDEEDHLREKYEGLSEDAFAMLSADDDVTVVSSETYQSADPVTQQPVALYNAIAERVETKKVRKVVAVPPEEIIFSKNARDIQSAPYWAHVSPTPQADVIARFPDKEEEIRKAPAAVAGPENGEATNRQTVQDGMDGLQANGEINRDMRLVELVEHYIRLALEDDKVVRRYKITTVGTGYEILDIEEMTSWPIASGTPIIMPHRLIGRAVADLAIDVQQVQTSLLRATLNNAYFANNQRTEVAESHASENTIDDLLNNRVGGIVRTKIPGGLQQLQTQPIGHWTLPIIEHMASVRENRTGVSRYNQGLDADSLNHTATGVTRIMDAAEMRIKLIARTIAETLIVNMMRGIHQMMQEYDEEARTLELRGKWTPIDPREWKKRNKMKVTLPLGGASKQMLLQFFSTLLGVQQQVILQQQGTNGPLVSWQNVYATAEQMTKLAGVKSVKPFFMEPPPPDMNAPLPPNPEMVKAQSQAQALQVKTQGHIATTQAKAQADIANAKVKATLEAQLDQMRAQMEHQREQDVLARQQLMERIQMQHEMQMEALRTGHDLRVDSFKAQHAAKIAQQTADSKSDSDE